MSTDPSSVRTPAIALSDRDGKLEDYKLAKDDSWGEILKSIVLSSDPEVRVDITLDGCCPELRFSDGESVFTMSGETFVMMTGIHFGERGFEPVCLKRYTDRDGRYCLVKYERAASDASKHVPIEVFNLDEHALQRLRAEHGVIVDHVVMLMSNEEAIIAMLRSVADVYRSEYRRLNSPRSIAEHFHELSHIVETRVPAADIVKAFLEKLHAEKLKFNFNPYSLLAVILPQRDVILNWIQGYWNV